MRQSSRNKGPAELPDGNDPPVSGALSNSSHIGDDHPVGELSLAESQRNVRESELLRQIAIKANDAASVDEAIQMCLDAVCAYTGWPVGHAYMPTKQGTGELESTKLWHIDDPERYENFRSATEATDYTYDQGLPSRVVAEAAPQWMVADMTHQQSPRENARIEADLKSGFAFPAMAGKAVVAVLEFFSPEIIEPDPQFLSVTAEIGILIGQVIEHRQVEQALRDREQALADSETRYRQLAELSPDGMLVHVDGEIVFANASLARILAVSSPEDLLGTQSIELIAPEYRASMERRRGKVLKGETSAVAQTEFERADGSRVPVERTATQISWEGNPAIVVLFRDTSERAEAERALVESRDQLRLVTDNLPEWITYIDAEQRYRFVNKTSAEWLARPVEEIVGRTVSELMGQEYEKFRSLIDKVLAGEQQGYIMSVNLPDGVPRTLQTSYVPHRGEDGNVEGYFALAVDISELQQAEEALRQAQKMEVVGKLTGGVAHDFNNLLAVVMGNLEMVADHLQADTPIFNYVRNAFTAAERGASLTHHLLAFARQQVLRPEETDLARLIFETKELMSVSMGEKIVVEIHTGDDLWHCKVDQAQLQNAILNLSINARDAMPSGGNVTISAENAPLDAERAEVLELDVGDYVCLSVSDTGPGIPEDVLEHVYEPFFTTKDVGEGSGLGLSMVYGFVQQSGGSVDIETGEGEGTSVKLYFPAIVPDEATAAEVSTKLLDEGIEPDTTILLVEDNAAFREVTRAILESLNFRVIDFGTAEEALTVVGDTTPFDLLLSDIGLPGQMNGHDLAEYAKSARPDLKTVLMSAHADLQLSGGIIDDNVAAFLTKPHRKAELVQTLRQVLDIDTLAT